MCECVCVWGAVLFCLGGFSVCALHGGSRLLLHYQLFRKPAVIFSFFLPVSHAKGYPIVSGVTRTCNFCCFLMCINQLLEKSKQLLFIYFVLLLYFLEVMGTTVSSIPYVAGYMLPLLACQKILFIPTLMSISCSRVQEKHG